MTLLLAACIGAFFLGSIPFGIIVGKLLFRKDIRASGSGNIGAANALRTLGKSGAALVLLLDAAKGFVPAGVPMLAAQSAPMEARALFNVIAAAAGFAALLGHCYSPWLRFRGGKGVATHLGVLFALSWPVGLLFIVVWAAAALSSGYSSAGSLVATLVSAAALWMALGPVGLGYGAAAAAVIVWRHRENIARLRMGTEHRMSLRKRGPAG